jgi:hypothetical protein
MAVSYRFQISKRPIDLYEIWYQRDVTRSLLQPRKPTLKFHRFRNSKTGAQLLICVSGALVPLNIGDWSDELMFIRKMYNILTHYVVEFKTR